VELTEVPLPDELGPDEALLAVEACGMCGTDYEQYQGSLDIAHPYIAGHEFVGRLAAIGPDASARWGLGAGARVAVESIVSCRRCRECRAGRPLHCRERLIYGLTPLARSPGLLGGYAEYVVLQPNTEVYPVAEHLSPEDAVLFNPLGAGFDWTCRVGGTGVDDRVLIIGPGQRGQCCIVAAREAGASQIIVAGRGRRPWKLDVARSLGATDVVDTDATPLVDAVRELTGGEMVDGVIETASLATRPVADAVNSVRAEGTVVFAGLKASGGDLGAVYNTIMRNGIVVRGAFSVSDWAKRKAIEWLSTTDRPLHRLHTHTLAIDELDRAFRVLGGEIAGDDGLHITVVPA
jgi:threonine dehydrogenase-like Zn-dependent dehydrogenase